MKYKEMFLWLPANSHMTTTAVIIKILIKVHNGVLYQSTTGLKLPVIEYKVSPISWLILYNR